MRSTILGPSLTLGNLSSSLCTPPKSIILGLLGSLRWYERLRFVFTRRLPPRCLGVVEDWESEASSLRAALTQLQNSQPIIYVVSIEEPTEFGSPVESSSTTRVH